MFMETYYFSGDSLNVSGHCWFLVGNRHVSKVLLDLFEHILRHFYLESFDLHFLMHKTSYKVFDRNGSES